MVFSVHVNITYTYKRVEKELFSIFGDLCWDGFLQDMEKELADITKTEDGAIADFESLVAAKEKEIAAATEAIEMKLEKNGEMAVKIVNLKNDLEDAQESLGEDQKFLAELKKGCSTAGADYDSRVKGRAEELVAVQETIKILNDDDASADRQM